MDWMARAAQLVNLIDPERGFKAGEFENLDTKDWAKLVASLRAIVGTDHALEATQLRAQLAVASAREAARQKALAAGLTQQEIEDLKG